ncbi:unnamed protein product, partial [Adineta ricciae]
MEKTHRIDIQQIEKDKKSLEEQLNKFQKRLQDSSVNEDKLRQQLNKTEQLLKEAKQRFITEEERVNSDIRIKQIEQKLIESQTKVDELQQ